LKGPLRLGLPESAHQSKVSWMSLFAILQDK